MILLEFSPAERQLMRTLLAQYDELVHADDDPVLERLFPVAYRDDPDAAAEFARYTRSGLVETKSSRAGVIAAAVARDDSALVLSDEDAAAWLPVLTDLRLIVANRLGIVRDEDEVPDDPLGEVYHWLGQLQSYLVDALDALA
jgi:hypothetical protein